MSKVIYCSKPGGVVSRGYYRGRPISGICGSVKCFSSECSKRRGGCDLQTTKNPDKEDQPI